MGNGTDGGFLQKVAGAFQIIFSDFRLGKKKGQAIALLTQLNYPLPAKQVGRRGEARFPFAWNSINPSDPSSKTIARMLFEKYCKENFGLDDKELENFGFKKFNLLTWGALLFIGIQTGLSIAALTWSQAVDGFFRIQWWKFWDQDSRSDPWLEQGSLAGQILNGFCGVLKAILVVPFYAGIASLKIISVPFGSFGRFFAPKMPRLASSSRESVGLSESAEELTEQNIHQNKNFIQRMLDRFLRQSNVPQPREGQQGLLETDAAEQEPLISEERQEERKRAFIDRLFCALPQSSQPIFPEVKIIQEKTDAILNARDRQHYQDFYQEMLRFSFNGKNGDLSRQVSMLEEMGNLLHILNSQKNMDEILAQLQIYEIRLQESLDSLDISNEELERFCSIYEYRQDEVQSKINAQKQAIEQTLNTVRGNIQFFREAIEKVWLEQLGSRLDAFGDIMMTAERESDVESAENDNGSDSFSFRRSIREFVRRVFSRDAETSSRPHPEGSGSNWMRSVRSIVESLPENVLSNLRTRPFYTAVRDADRKRQERSEYSRRSQQTDLVLEASLPRLMETIANNDLGKALNSVIGQFKQSLKEKTSLGYAPLVREEVSKSANGDRTLKMAYTSPCTGDRTRKLLGFRGLFDAEKEMVKKSVFVIITGKVNSGDTAPSITISGMDAELVNVALAAATALSRILTVRGVAVNIHTSQVINTGEEMFEKKVARYMAEFKMSNQGVGSVQPKPDITVQSDQSEQNTVRRAVAG